MDPNSRIFQQNPTGIAHPSGYLAMENSHNFPGNPYIHGSSGNLIQQPGSTANMQMHHLGGVMSEGQMVVVGAGRQGGVMQHAGLMGLNEVSPVGRSGSLKMDMEAMDTSPSGTGQVSPISLPSGGGHSRKTSGNSDFGAGPGYRPSPGDSSSNGGGTGAGKGSSLGVHRGINSSSSKPILKCPYCSKVFYNSSAIAKHKLTHSDERKYVCNVCNKAFKRQDHLNGHRLTHETKKPHACNFCEKSYSDARSLKRHYENAHSEEVERTSGSRREDTEEDSGASPADPYALLEEPKRVQCSVCQKRFKNQAALNGHMRLHGGYGKPELGAMSPSEASQDSSCSNSVPIQTTGGGEVPNSGKVSNPGQHSSYQWSSLQSHHHPIPAHMGQSEQAQHHVTSSAAYEQLLLACSPLRSGLSSNVSPNPGLDNSLLQPLPSPGDFSLDLDFSPGGVGNKSDTPSNCGSSTGPTTGQPSGHSLLTTVHDAARSQYSPIPAKGVDFPVVSISHSDPTLTDLNAGEVSPYNSGSEVMASLLKQEQHRQKAPAHTMVPILQIPESAVHHSQSVSNYSSAMDNLIQHQQQMQQQQQQRHSAYQNPGLYYRPVHLDPVPRSSGYLVQSSHHHHQDPHSPPPITSSLIGSSLSQSTSGSVWSREGDAPPVDDRLTRSFGDGILFRNPHTPPKKLKKKPAPLFIPPQTSVYMSRLRSPRVWDPTRCCTNLSPPPYTPPPMLSPVRKGSGLFASLGRSAAQTPCSAPVTPRLTASASAVHLASAINAAELRIHRSNSGDAPSPVVKIEERSPQITKEEVQSREGTAPLMFGYDMDLTRLHADTVPMETEDMDEAPLTSVLPMINVGCAYQAVLPDYNSNKKSAMQDDRLTEHLLWDPANFEDDPVKNESLNLLMKIACSPAVKDCGLNMEYTFHLLCKFKGNFDETLQALLHEAFVVYDYVYAETTSWTTEEIFKFQQGLGMHDRDFYKVSQELKSAGMDKSVKACVEFYYMWKKMNTWSEVQKYRSMGRRKRDHQQQISPSFVTGGVEASQPAPPSEDGDSYNLRKKTGEHMCEGCGQVYTSMRQLNMHSCQSVSDTSRSLTPDSLLEAVVEDMTAGEFPCRLCSKVFTKVKSRNAHMKSHSDKVRHDH